jgi:hypothetical protein
VRFAGFGGALVSFEDLYPGDCFMMRDSNGAPQFCMVAKFPKDRDNGCLILGTAAEEEQFTVSAMQKYETVLNFRTAAIHPRLGSGLKLADNYALGSLVVASDGLFLVGRNRNASILHVHIESGEIRSPAQRQINFAAWDLLAQDPITEEWVTLLSHD